MRSQPFGKRNKKKFRKIKNVVSFLAVQTGRKDSVKMVQKLGTRYTITVATLLAHVVTFTVETRKVEFKYTKMCFFQRTSVLECMKEAVEEGEEGNYGGVVVVLVAAWRASSWRARYDLHNGILTEVIRQEVRE